MNTEEKRGGFQLNIPCIQICWLLVLETLITMPCLRWAMALKVAINLLTDKPNMEAAKRGHKGAELVSFMKLR